MEVLVTGVAGFIGSNLLAATTNNPDAVNEVYDVAVGDPMSLGFVLLDSAAAVGALPAAGGC